MNILFVCNGNIGRSPLAKAILQRKYKEAGIKAEVDSAGFEPLYINESPDKRILEFGKEVGLVFNDKARIFQKSDFQKFDKIYVMDTKSYNDVSELAKDDQQIQQIDYLMNLVEPHKNKTVPDPITSWKIDIKTVYDLLDEATDVILNNTKR